jgi:cytochrome c oxidase cbb3-type subunit 3
VSDFVSALISVPTLVNIAAVLWLLWWTSRRRGEAGKADHAPAETTGHVWDGDLTEYNKPLPRWWLGLFIATVIFGLVYLALYPGLGNYAGAKRWTQEGQHRAQSEKADALLARALAPFENASIETLMQDPDAIRRGRNVFLNNCAGCHGSDGRGAPGFPNLADDDWLWGNAPETVLASIQQGRMGVMPAWAPVLGAAGVEDTLAYVMSLSGRKLPAGNVAAGKQRFAEVCSACHGADGRGNPLLGAPNLTDNVWLYGGSVAAVRDSIAKGRQGQMPAHGDLLGETRTKLLAAYVLSLSAEQGASPVLSSAGSAPSGAASAAGSVASNTAGASPTPDSSGSAKPAAASGSVAAGSAKADAAPALAAAASQERAR